MQIGKNSWHYRMYRKSYLEDSGIPSNTSLCQYMRRIIIYLPLMYILAIILNVSMVFFVVLYNIGYLIVSGNKYLPYWESSPKDIPERFMWIVKIIRSTLVVVLVSLFLLGNYSLVERDTPNIFGGIAIIIDVIIVIPSLLGIVLFAFGVIGYGDSFRRKGFSLGGDDVFIQWFKAKKEKICPLVTFDD